jgi:Pyruvate/2-oxoacid:ferredoxin oxidoreductase gamma subunit
MERELIATGIGGQGVQLAAQITARAAVHQGLQVQMFGSYGGMMRGGNTDAAVVLAEGPVMAPPVVPSCWIGMAMHHAYLPPLLDKLRPDSLLFVNTSVVEDRSPVGAGVTVVDVPATDLAIDVGSAMAASVVMLGAIVGATGLLTRDAVLSAIDESLPPYRQQHRDLNGRALDAGIAAAPVGLPVAWPAMEEAR